MMRSNCLILSCLAMAACSSDPGAISLEFSWPDADPQRFDLPVFLSARLGGPSEIDLPRRPFPAELTLDFGTPLNGDGYVVSADVFDGPWRNSVILYRGTSVPFSLEPGLSRTIMVQMKEVLEESTLDSSAALVGATFEHRATFPDVVDVPSESLHGTIASAPSGSKLLVFAGSNVREPPLATLDVMAGEPFVVDFRRPAAPIVEPVYVAVQEPDLLLTDASDAPGLQAELVGSFVFEVAAEGGWRQTRVDPSWQGPSTATTSLTARQLSFLATAREPAVEVEARPYWIETGSTAETPLPFFAAVAATDAENARALVVFANEDGGAETWIRDRERWRPVERGAVTPFDRNLAIAYDNVNEEFILLGKMDESEVVRALTLRDEWQEEPLPVGFPLVQDLSAAFHQELATLVVIGTTTSALTTWTRDASGTWSEDQRPGPPLLGGHAMAYDPTRERILVFGTADLNVAETWEWDATGWTDRKPVQQPLPRGLHAMVFDPESKKLLVMGGLDFRATPLPDVWSWDGSAWTEEEPVAPYELRSGLYANAAFADPEGAGVLVFGGSRAVSPRTAFGFARWRQRKWLPEPDASSPPPTARVDGAAVFDASRGEAILEGGSPLGVTTYVKRGRVWTPGPDPVALRLKGPAMAFDASRGETYLFSGNASPQTSTTTLVWSESGWREVQTTGSPPPAREDARAVYDEIQQAVILSGGTTGRGSSNDLWKFTGDVWENVTPPENPVPPRALHGFARGAAEDQFVLFGGLQDETTPLDDTFVTNDLSAWSLPTAGPLSPRWSFVFVSDPGRGQVVLFGGRDEAFEPLPDAWEYQRGWSQVAPETDGPGARAGAAALYDPNCECIVMMGGVDSNRQLRNDTWEYHHPTSLSPAIALLFPVVSPGAAEASVDVVVGGRGDSDAGGISGAVVQAYDHRHSRWRRLGETGADAFSPQRFSATIPLPFRDFVRHRAFTIRVRPTGADGTSSTPSRVTVFSARAVVAGRHDANESNMCGDGFVFGAERCDDGNVLDGDGCNSACIREP